VLGGLIEFEVKLELIIIDVTTAYNVRHSVCAGAGRSYPRIKH
jgi:hypothetical protein